MIKRINPYFYFESDLMPEKPVIVEVGCYSGTDLRKMKEFYPNAKLIAYEASKTNFENLKSREDNKCIICHNKAVTKEQGFITFHEFDGTKSSHSIYPRESLQKKRKLIKSDKVPTTNIEGILKENGLDYIDCMLLNCEGAELPILEELCEKQEIRNRVKQMCVSLHTGRTYKEEEIKPVLKEISKYYEVIDDAPETNYEYLLMKLK